MSFSRGGGDGVCMLPVTYYYLCSQPSPGWKGMRAQFSKRGVGLGFFFSFSLVGQSNYWCWRSMCLAGSKYSIHVSLEGDEAIRIVKCCTLGSGPTTLLIEGPQGCPHGTPVILRALYAYSELAPRNASGGPPSPLCDPGIPGMAHRRSVSAVPQTLTKGNCLSMPCALLLEALFWA